MKKYSMQLVSLVLFSAIFVPGMIVGMNYANVYVQNNLMTALQIGDKVVESGEIQFLDNSTNPHLFAQVYRKGDSPASSDNKNLEYKEQLEKMYLHPGASLLVTIDRSIWSPTWTYTWEWINTSDLEEKRHKTLSEKTTFLPLDVKKIIANNALRLILDEATNKPEILLRKQWRAPKGVIEMTTSLRGMLGIEKAPLIDMIILLIENGADPNTKNYNGQTVVHLLIKDLVLNTERQLNEASAKDRDLSDFTLEYKEKLNTLKVKLELLAKHKVNLNIMVNGFFVAHDLIMFALKALRFHSIYWGEERFRELSDSTWAFLSWLKELGMDFTTVKNHTGVTACEYGWNLIKNLLFKKYQQDKLNELCSPLRFGTMIL